MLGAVATRLAWLTAVRQADIEAAKIATYDMTY